MLPLHHDPLLEIGCIRFHCAGVVIVLVLSCCGSPESRTQRHSVISRMWATGPRLPDRRTGHLGAPPSTQLMHVELRSFHAVGRAVLESASPGLRPALHHLSYQPKQKRKKPDVLVTPGFRYSQSVRPSVTCVMDRTGIASPIDRRSYPLSCAVRDLAVLKSLLSLRQTAKGSHPQAVSTLSYHINVVNEEKVPKDQEFQKSLSLIEGSRILRRYASGPFYSRTKKSFIDPLVPSASGPLLWRLPPHRGTRSPLAAGQSSENGSPALRAGTGA